MGLCVHVCVRMGLGMGVIADVSGCGCKCGYFPNNEV